jgi:hypothetical protein
MASKFIRRIFVTALTLSIVLAGASRVLAAPIGTSPNDGQQASSLYSPGLAGRTVCVAELFCSPVVAQLGNPPGSAAWKGITQATLTYPGHSFGPIFLAHLGTPEGWAFYEVKIGDPISVLWSDGGRSAYRVVSISRYKLAGSGKMQDLSTGRSMTNMEVYAANQSDPYLSLETCLGNPNPATDGAGNLSLGGSEWGRMFIMAEPVSN